MDKKTFEKKLHELNNSYEELILRKNEKLPEYNGIYEKYKHPVLTNYHAPIFWRFDLNYETNPMLLQRIGINA
ncbi:MAG: glycosidase, partial [Candidatus Paceibacterota bacterium]